MFLDKKHSSKVFQTLLAVLDLSKVAVAEVFCKKVLLKISQTTGVFLQILRDFQEHLFRKSPPVAASEKLKNRSSRPEVLCKKGVLRNLSKFKGKYLCQVLRVFPTYNSVYYMKRSR